MASHYILRMYIFVFRLIDRRNSQSVIAQTGLVLDKEPGSVSSYLKSGTV